MLIGEDPRDINRLTDKMVKKSVTPGRRGAVMHVISGIEIALWDILGKATGQPVHRLRQSDRFEVCDQSSIVCPIGDADPARLPPGHLHPGDTVPNQ